MSIHRDITACEGRNTDAGRETFWVARCDCGWEGEAHSSSASGAAADFAHRGYRTHVEEALLDAYYQAPIRCRNCGSEHTQGILIGTHVMSNACERCGTVMIEPDNDTWHESREITRRMWG